MATFPYRCPVDGPFDLQFPIGTATTSTACPRCGADAVRVWTAPMIATGDRVRTRLVDRCERSRTEPDVVTAPPAAGRRATPSATTTAASRHPAWDRLPRP